MKISVCMASFNGETYISQQLASIIDQLAGQDEVIISDDSSTDGTLDIIHGLRDSRIRLFAGNPFHSPVYNVENAIKKAEGDVIVLADQDDMWLPNKLPVVRDWFSQRTPGINMLVLDGQMVDDHGRVLHNSLFEMLRARRGVLKNVYRNTYMGCCMAFSRDLLSVALPFPRNIPMHDSWLGILSELYGTVEFVPEKTIRYRRHLSNASFGRFTVGQQTRWRFFLACHLMRRICLQPPPLVRRSPHPTPSSRSPAH